jgi:hypothetical protein
MNDNEQVFLDFWQHYQWPKIKPLIRRLYYDELGSPLFYTTEDLPGNYIDVTPEQMRDADMNIRVIKGKLVSLLPKSMVKKLRPSDQGTPCDPNDITLIRHTDPNTKWQMKW